MFELFILWIICGFAACFVANSRGASGCLWFGIGMMLGPIGLAMSFATGPSRVCQFCKKGVAEGAVKCPYCQSDISSGSKSGDRPAEPMNSNSFL